MQLPCSTRGKTRGPWQSSQTSSTSGEKIALLPGPSLPAGVTLHLPGALGPADQSFDWQLGMILIIKKWEDELMSCFIYATLIPKPFKTASLLFNRSSLLEWIKFGAPG